MTDTPKTEETQKIHPGQLLRELLTQESPLQIAGTINAYTARLARRAGFRAIYLSGAGVANASLGIPDLGLTRLQDVTEDARRICTISPLPLLVDADTGWDSPAETVQTLEGAGVAGIHLEDQVAQKRCGHRPGKQLVATEVMVERLQDATQARQSNQFVVMARTDAHAVEGLESAIARACRYVEAGADMIFAEALADLSDFAAFCAAVPAPVLANATEFGKTPLYGLQELKNCGVAMVLYPLSAFRAMSAAALYTYETIRRDGTQKFVVANMQPRSELYDILDYERFERALDAALDEKSEDES